MISVAEAEQIILNELRDYGTELVAFEQAAGRILAADILADRDIPACNKATMDGIAIRGSAYERGLRSFHIKAITPAGAPPPVIEQEQDCSELMTGAAVPDGLDTVVRYEDLDINDGVATILNEATVNTGQNIHRKGSDSPQGAAIAAAGRHIDATTISIAASVGDTMLTVRKLPSVIIITTGDELTNIATQPSPYQLRSSNNYTVKAALEQYHVPCDMLHLPDESTVLKQQISDCLSRYDVLILTGGVSMGKFDHIPLVMEQLDVTCLFHKITQKPGKPFWFGMHSSGRLIFAFPGNPVSTFLCLHRYFIPWLKACLSATVKHKKAYAVLDSDVAFSAPLQYFVQVSASINEQGQLIAAPVAGNGSGHFTNLAAANAFIELPADKKMFLKGEVYRIWPFKPIV